MAFEVIPFCRIVKFSGITRFLYQFWKILPKYCGRKEKDHNILWSKWYSRRESNPQRPLRRGLLYPFNYGSVLNFIARGRNHCRKKFYTKIYTSFFPPRENKHKSSGFARKTCVLGNILWIEQYLRRGLLYPFNYGSVLRCKFPPPGGYQPKPLKGSPRLSVASLARTTAAFQRGLLYPFNYGSV